MLPDFVLKITLMKISMYKLIKLATEHGNVSEMKTRL